jgi:outer membrane scaffolding protein for murein synthesis (MipA/OmpV family)
LVSLGNQDKLNNTKLVRAALLLALVATCAGAEMASAADVNHDTARRWSGSVGLSAVHQPTYFGSPNNRTAPLPLLSVSYRDPILGTFALDQQTGTICF